MEFLLEFFLLVLIICVLFLVLKLKESKTNADSLQNQLNQIESSSNVRESQFHRTIIGLQDALATEQGNIKTREVITFIEVKTGKSQLSSKQRHIRDLIKNKQVAWKEIRIK